MHMTLLQMTQDIMSSLSSDEVNSISDTVESMQVATIIKNKYFDVVNRVDLPEHEQLIQLLPSLDSTSPVQMFVPDNVAEIKWLKYFNTNINSQLIGNTVTHGVNTNIVPTVLWSTTSTTSNTIGLGVLTFTVGSATLPIKVSQIATATSGSNSVTGSVTAYTGTSLSINVTSRIGSGTFTSWIISALSNQFAVPGYAYVTILPVKQFIDMVNTFNPSDINVFSFIFTDNVNGIPGTYKFYYKNNKQPQYCCILSDFNVIFDGYDSTQDSTLQMEKTMAWGKIIPVFNMVDSFIPDMDDEQFTLLFNEAKAMAFFELKQSPHPKAEMEIKRGWSSVQKTKAIVNRPTYFNQLPNFGRRGIGFTSPVSYFKSRGWDASNG